ncbi:MAG: hypothetical protein ABIA37_00240 [Candidatus Woesearchaeota archaeon]
MPNGHFSKVLHFNGMGDNTCYFIEDSVVNYLAKRYSSEQLEDQYSLVDKIQMDEALEIITDSTGNHHVHQVYLRGVREE